MEKPDEGAPEGNELLATITSQEMLDELGKRAEAIVCIMYHDRSKDIDHTSVFSKGQTPLIIGLIECARNNIRERLFGAHAPKPPFPFES